jgi:hypothetical protein
VARVKADADTKMLAELERLRQEATDARVAQEQTQAEVERLREAAAQEALRSAEEASARAEAEVARVKEEADATLQAEIERLRSEAEQSRQRAREQSERDTEAIRDAATLEAQEAAARALESEIARVREEAERRLQEELGTARREADHAREALEHAQRDASRSQQTEDETARAFQAEAARIRAEAEERLREETERARRDAEARLEAEVSSIRAEAEQRRTEELEEVRGQMLRLRQASAEQARLAAEQAAAAEVARIKAMSSSRPESRQLAVRERFDDFVADHRPRQVARQARPGGRTWLIAAALALVAVAGGAYALGLVPTGGSDSASAAASVDEPAFAEPGANILAEDSAAAGTPVAVAPATGELIVESVPEGARVLLDGREAGYTPLRLREVRAGGHEVVLEGSAGTLRRTVQVQGGETTVARYEITAGFLALLSSIPLEIYNGSARVGSSDEGHLQLQPGQYTIRVVNQHFRYDDTVDVEVRPGEITSYTVGLPRSPIHVTTEPGSDVYVDGQPVGTAPLGPTSVPIGRREVLVRHPQFGEQRQAVDVFFGQAADVTIVLEGAGPRQPPQLLPLSRQPERRILQ